MQTLLHLQPDYTVFQGYYQIKLPLEMETMIPADDPVRLLSAFVEGMDLSELYATYDRVRKNQATPRQMLKIMVYAAMNHLYSSRDIETACRRDINFMFLLEGMPVPDHATFARFLSLHLSACSRNVLAEATDALFEMGEISGNTIFIDGTKIEANANKYTFVWKKTVTKNQEKLFVKIETLVARCEELFGIKIVYHDRISIRTLKRLRKALYRIKKEEGIPFVHGSGKRKTQLQKEAEELDNYLGKLKEYNKKLYICGERNSYSKTDPDATFMRTKEDAMKNGQLKPCYNLQHGVDGQYVTWLSISHYPTDTRTLIPFLKDMEAYLPFKYQEIVADAGYESEENYVFIEGNGQLAFIKPMNYEVSRSRKYKRDIGRMENMMYDPEKDRYYCKNGKELTAQYEKNEKTATGYHRVVTVYRCEDCSGCAYKAECIKGNNCKTPLQDRTKTLFVSKLMQEKRKKSLERISSDYGIQLRINRSIQAEGSFAVIKEDMNFRQYLYRGKENVMAQSVIAAIAYNIKKLHCKIQSGKTGQHLVTLEIA